MRYTSPPRRQIISSDSSETAKYATILSHPFIPPAHSPYCPVFPCVPTQKVTVKATFEVVTNAAGYGQIIFSPCGANNRDSAAFSNLSTYAGTGTLIRVTTATTGVTGVPLPTPYTNSQLAGVSGANGNKVNMCRIVSFGARLVYTGPLTNRAGTVYAITTSDNSDISVYTLSQAYTNPEDRKSVV